MNEPSKKVRQVFVLKNRFGMHARPAAMFVKTVSAFTSEITVHKDDLQVSGKSIMELLVLAAAPGDSLTVVAEGPDADAAMVAIAELFEVKFNDIA